jgi:hypothetical protein
MLHAVAPVSALYLPAPQSEHVLTAVAPTAIEYLPAVQLAHALTPASEENLPATQLTQTSTEEEEPATVAYLPATHDTHESGEDAQREPRCLPAGQAVQLDEPAASA